MLKLCAVANQRFGMCPETFSVEKDETHYIVDFAIVPSLSIRPILCSRGVLFVHCSAQAKALWVSEEVFPMKQVLWVIPVGKAQSVTTTSIP